MDRSEFLRMSIGAGVCCGAAALLGGSRRALAAAPEAAAAPGTPPVTPCGDRVVQGQTVLRRLMRQLDATFPKDVRDRFMAGCGRACFEGANGPRKDPPSREQARRFLEKIETHVGAQNVRRSGGETIVRFEFTENPRGLKTADRYCLCPIMEDAPQDVSPTYCQCSVGYVQEIFERGMGTPASVVVLDSVLRGGKSCVFEVRFTIGA